MSAGTVHSSLSILWLWKPFVELVNVLWDMILCSQTEELLVPEGPQLLVCLGSCLYIKYVFGRCFMLHLHRLKTFAVLVQCFYIVQRKCKHGVIKLTIICNHLIFFSYSDLNNMNWRSEVKIGSGSLQTTQQIKTLWAEPTLVKWQHSPLTSPKLFFKGVSRTNFLQTEGLWGAFVSARLCTTAVECSQKIRFIYKRWLVYCICVSV